MCILSVRLVAMVLEGSLKRTDPSLPHPRHLKGSQGFGFVARLKQCYELSVIISGTKFFVTAARFFMVV